MEAGTSRPQPAAPPAPGVERPSGPVAAVLLATGIGSLVLAILVIISEASESFADSLAYSERVGPLSGKTIWAVAAFVGSWAILGVLLRSREVDLRKVTIVAAILIALAFLGTFEPFFPNARTTPTPYIGLMTERATFRVKRGLAEMLKGGVIMDVTTAEQAQIAEEAGAVAVMALERVPADIRAAGGVARMANPGVIKQIQEAVTIPVMAKARIGHFAEAQVLQSLEVDYIDESEVLTPADEAHHIDKHAFEVPFVCGATNLGEAVRRVGEGAAMIRSKGEAGTGNIVEAVRHLREIVGAIKRLGVLGHEQLAAESKELGAPLEIVEEVARTGWLPVPLFCAGGIATPADAALVMQLGAEGNFVGSGIFKSEDPERRARAIVEATTHFKDPERVAAASMELGEPMRGDDIAQLAAEGELLQQRGV